MTVTAIRKKNENFLHVFLLAHSYFTGQKTAGHKCLTENLEGKTVLAAMIENCRKAINIPHDITVVVSEDSKIIAEVPKSVRILRNACKWNRNEKKYETIEDWLDGEVIELCLDNSYSNRCIFVDTNISFEYNFFEHISLQESNLLACRDFHNEEVYVVRDYDGTLENLVYNIDGEQFTRCFYVQEGEYEQLKQMVKTSRSSKYESYQLLQSIAGNGGKIKVNSTVDVKYLKGKK